MLKQKHKWFSNKYLWIFLICVLSRLLTTIYYIEDPDSLHFALAATDYNIANFQPHFPGYPVFCFLLQVFTFLFGSFALAFSLIGGISTFAIIFSAMEIAKMIFPKANNLFVGVLIFLNPFIWLMANRYMADLLGVALAMLAFYYFIKQRERDALIFQFLTALLAGTRLSVLSFLLAPSLYLLIKNKNRFAQVLVGIAGVLIWFVPMLLDTGLDQLMASAQLQTEGHFYEWGGTINEEASFSGRFVAFAESIWAHGLGAYWSGRGALTLVIGAGLFLGLALFIASLLRKKQEGKLKWLILSFMVYLTWVFFFQNVVYKPRHILPVLPFLLIVIAVGYSYIMEKQKLLAILSFLVLVSSMGALTFKLVKQHKQPSAIAQAKDFLKGKEGKKTFISIALVNEFMRKQGVEARFLAVENDMELIKKVVNENEPYYVIGKFGFTQSEASSNEAFYHNPYVNKMWPVIVLSEYNTKN